MKILDLGCGKNKTPGAIGVDSNPESEADVRHDLDSFPYPFTDSEFDRVICMNIMEHLDDPVGAISEIWRIIRPGGILEIASPFPSSRWLFSDPTHRRAFTSKSFDFFIPGSELFGRINSPAKFELVEIRYVKDPHHFWEKPILWLANSFKDKYESWFMYIYQMPAIYFRLKAIKQEARGTDGK